SAFATLHSIPFVGHQLDGKVDVLSGPLAQIGSALSGAGSKADVQNALTNLAPSGFSLTVINIQDVSSAQHGTGVQFEVRLHAEGFHFTVPNFDLGLGNIFNVASNPFTVNVSFDDLLQVEGYQDGAIQFDHPGLASVDSNLPNTPLSINLQ